MRKDDENSGSNCAQPDSSPVDRHDDRRTTVLGQLITSLGEPINVNLVAFHPTDGYLRQLVVRRRWLRHRGRDAIERLGLQLRCNMRRRRPA